MLHKRTLAALMLTAVLLLSFAVATTIAVHDEGLFELDENAVAEADPGDDWDLVYNGTSSALRAVFVADGDDFSGGITVPPGLPTDDVTYFTTGGSKDVNDINQWMHQTGDVAPDKDEILNAYAAAYTDGDGDLIIYFGLDRLANNGDAQVGFWFFQSEHALNPDGTFSGVHDLGDILVLSHFTKGGNVDTIEVYEWVGPPDADNVALIATGVECALTAPGDDVCATVNDFTEDAPWPYVAKFPERGESENDFAPGSFYEGGVNVSELGLDLGCGGTFLAETRSSQSLDAQLKDFALGDFSLCSLEVDKDGDTLSKVGDDVTYTITITNTGVIALYKQSIVDTVFGDLTDGTNPLITSTTCGASLAAGASCTIEVERTVLGSDPDPLDNTVDVVYNSSSDLTGAEVSGSDDHSVNLFQPSIDFDKAANMTLSKQGDPITYTLTLDNTSSDDTPDLDCTVTDTPLGINLSFSLASGGQHKIIKQKIMPAGPDPYVNTANVSCQVDGFSNILTDSDSWSVNLFQPSILFDKSADTNLSKLGDTVNYTLTLTNTSSTDSPALDCTITDAVLGVNAMVSLASGADHVINKSLVMPSAPDPYVNTASVSCQVQGYSNILTDSDSWSVNLFQPSILFDKSADTNLSKEGDTVNYTLTLTNTSSTDSPDLDCTITDATLGIDEDFSLVPGGEHEISKGQVMPAAPDPYVNTANVSCQVQGFSNVLTDSDSWSVNLFQPSVTIDKTGDALSKVGDPVNYTITVTNTSSADSPNLTCAISDPLLGLNKQVNLAPGGSDVTNTSRVVQEGDPDPLVNTASVTCNVDGFPNVLGPVMDGHSTNLFQPGVEVIKSGPATAVRGETITYQFTINNLSSSDAPNLILDSVDDTIIGDLTAIAAANGCSTLGFGGTCNFTADYTIQPDDPNPVVNVVTVHYHPQGFPNDIWDDDDHEVQIPIQGCTPGFWQGGAGAPLWNEGPPDPDWSGEGVNPFIHTTLFNSYFNLVTDPRLNGYTMYALVSSGGGSDPAVKAARDMVAAYLNETAFPTEFPASSLADLLTMWYDAVAGGDAALTAFHNTVSGWNNPEEPGFCPLPYPTRS